MATFSGIVLVTGTNGIGPGGIFEPITFDSNFDYVYAPSTLSGTTWESYIIEPADMLAQVVSFEFRDQVYGVQKSYGAVLEEFLVINPAVDFTINMRTVASGGVTVLNFGFGTGLNFVVTPVSNRRIFPTSVADATLFPGDVPRGEPLNP